MFLNDLLFFFSFLLILVAIKKKYELRFFLNLHKLKTSSFLLRKQLSKLDNNRFTSLCIELSEKDYSLILILI